MAIFALVDCNNFFVSCERVFRPDLKAKPIVVLSNNDGCVISRSNEAKALGIKMGIPLFKIKDLVAHNNVNVFSSNFMLYGDMSKRVMATLTDCVPEIEIYSIDEAFLLLDGYSANLINYVKEIRKKVGQWTGIPVSIGLGPTKTIAKLANFIAKKYMKSGVYSLLDPAIRERAYKNIPVEEIWGVGRRLLKSLNAMGVFTVEDFVKMDSALIRKKFSVVLLKTQKELQGDSCIALEDDSVDPKSLISSRSFGKQVTELHDLQAAITMHIEKIAGKLRKKKLAVSQLYVYAYNNRFSDDARQFSCTVQLPYATNSTGPLLKMALRGIESVYEKGVVYKKVGVMAPELLIEGACAQDLFAPVEDPKQKQLSNLMDNINIKFGRHKIFNGSFGTKRDWLPKTLMRSLRYTTEYDELLGVN